MIETLFLIINLSGGIQFKDGPDSMFRHNPIPESVVRECSEWSGVNPYDEQQIKQPLKEMLFLECVYYDMGEHEHAII